MHSRTVFFTDDVILFGTVYSLFKVTGDLPTTPSQLFAFGVLLLVFLTFSVPAVLFQNPLRDLASSFALAGSPMKIQHMISPL